VIVGIGVGISSTAWLGGVVTEFMDLQFYDLAVFTAPDDFHIGRSN